MEAVSPRNFLVGDSLHAYLTAHAPTLDEIQQDLIEETAALGDDVANMQIAPDQGAFMGILTAAVGARSAVEVGTFTGYSALCLARALPPAPQGHLLSCDSSEEWTTIARRYWKRAGVDDRIELRLGEASDTLRALPHEEQFDVAFIDADKGGYPTYYRELLPRMRRDGLILVDNVLRHGTVADESTGDETTQQMRGFNDLVTSDSRVESTILTIADGLMLARKR